MLNTTVGIVKGGRVETLEPIPLPEGKRVLVTILPDDDMFWQEASGESLERIWNNDEDDVYVRPLGEGNAWSTARSHLRSLFSDGS